MKKIITIILLLGICLYSCTSSTNTLENSQQEYEEIYSLSGKLREGIVVNCNKDVLIVLEDVQSSLDETAIMIANA